MTPKRTAECPACHEQVTFFIVRNNVVTIGRGHDDDPKRRCVDCWERGREPARDPGMTPHAGAPAIGAVECHSARAGLSGAPAPFPVAGSGA